MNSENFTNHQTQNFIKSLQHDYMIYKVLRYETTPEQFESVLSAFKKIATSIHQRAIKSQVRIDSEQFRIKSEKDNGVHHHSMLTPQLRKGHSPFVFNVSGGDIKGVFVSFGQESKLPCKRSIKEAAEKLFEKHAMRGEVTSLRSCEMNVSELFLSGQKEIEDIPLDIPFVTSFNNKYIYLDFEGEYALLKSGAMQNAAINQVMELMKKAYQVMDEETPLKLDDEYDLLFEKRLEIKMYARHALGEAKTTHPYDLTELVKFYAHKNSAGDQGGIDAVQPLMTAHLSDVEDSSCQIRFTNSVGVMIDEDIEELRKASNYEILNYVSTKKMMAIKSLMMAGDTYVTKQLKNYTDAMLSEGVEDEQLKSDTYLITYKTQAKEGNIRFSIKQGISYHISAFKWSVREALNDRHFSPENYETFMLESMGGLLPLLHESTGLFIELYHEAFDIKNKPSEFGGGPTPMEKALS